jgi:hypothetical protein
VNVFLVIITILILLLVYETSVNIRIVNDNIKRLAKAIDDIERRLNK